MMRKKMSKKGFGRFAERRKRMSSTDINAEKAENTAAENEAAENTTADNEAADAAAAENSEPAADTAEQQKGDELTLKIEQLTAQLADQEEKYKRLDAEYYNYRTRSLKEKQDAANDATAKAVTEILSVIDNFERALAAETADETYKKGVEMIFRQFTDILKKMGVEEIEAQGKPFDPNFHHAVNQVEDENFGENTVCQVFRKGYKLGNKVIRCAMVVVANP